MNGRLLAFRADEDTERMLDDLAQQADETRSATIRRLIRNAARASRGLPPEDLKPGALAANVRRASEEEGRDD